MTAREMLDGLAADPAALDELRALVRSPTAYTVATLAAELGLSPRTIRAAIERDELDAVRRGRVWVISATAVEAWATSPATSRRRTSRRPLREVLG